MHTELRSLEELQLHFRVQQPLDGFNVLLGFESCEDIQVVVRLVEYPGVREPQVSSKTLYSLPLRAHHICCERLCSTKRLTLPPSQPLRASYVP